MTIRTGADYLESVRDGRQLYLHGELVKDVTTHPQTRAVCEGVAATHDLHHRDELKGLLTIERGGDVQSAGWMIPKSVDDLVHRRQVIELIARETGTVVSRPAEYGAITLLGMYDIRDDFAMGDKDRLDVFESVWEMCSSGDLHLAQGWIDPQFDRRKPAEETDLLRIVEKNAEGIVVSGVKATATQAPYANEILIGSFPRPGLSPDQVMYFIVPANHPGLKIVSRPSHSKESIENNPWAARGDELDAVLIFDNALIPWERVMAAGISPEAADRLFHRLCQFLHWSVLIRQGIKAEIFLGAASNVVDAIGTGRIPAVRDTLAELVRFQETIRAFLTSAEVLGVPNSWTGTMRPNSQQITAGRVYAAENWSRIVSLVQDLAGAGLLMQPDKEDYANPEIGPWMERIHEAVGFTAEEKSRVFRLAWDLTSTEAAARANFYERMNSAPWFITRSQLFDRYDRQRAKMAALRLAGVDPAKASVDLGQVERPWGAHLEAVLNKK